MPPGNNRTCCIFAKKLKMVFLTRIEHFNAAHKLQNPEWDKEKNKAVFGKCANENWHGHNYELHITIKGEPGKDTGYVFNAKTLSRIVQENILEKLDHKNLNLDVDFLKGKRTSTENLVIGIWEELAPLLQKEGVQLHHLRIYETPRIYVDYYGE